MSAVVTTPETASGKSYRDLWLVSLGHGLTHWYPATFYLLLPLIGKEMGLSYSQIGLVMTCQAIAGALSNIPGGMWVDTVGKKGFLLALSLFWVGFPYLLMGFTHSYVMLIICVSLVGIGNNLWHPTAIPTLGSRYPGRKGLVLSLHSIGGNAGDAIAPLVIGALLATLTWRQIVVLNVVPGIFMSCLILAFLGTLRLTGMGDGDRKQSAGTESGIQGWAEYFRGLRKLFDSRGVLALLASSSFRSLTASTLMTFLPVFLAYELHYSPFWVGACMFALQVAGFAAAPLGGHLADKMGPRRIVMTSMGMTAVVLVLMAFAGRSHAFVFFIAALGFFMYAIRSVMQAWMLDSAPKNMGGTSIGMLFGFQALGGSVGPSLGGILADRYGLIATFYFLALTIVVANLFIFFMPVAPKGADAT